MTFSSIRALAKVARIHWFAVVVCVLLGAGIAAGVTVALPVTYESSARLFLATPNWNDNTASAQPDNQGRVQAYAFGDQFTQRRILSYQQLANTDRVLDGVIRELGLDTTPRELADRVDARVIPDTVMLDVRARESSPELARRVADATAKQLTNIIEELETPFKQAESPVLPVLIEPAGVPIRPATPRLSLNLFGGVVLGLLVGVTYAAIRERARDAAYPEDLVLSPLTLGVVRSPGNVSTLVDLDDLGHVVAEDVRYLCLRLRNALDGVPVAAHGQSPRAVLFASPREDDSAATAAILVAAGLAELDQRVAIVLTNFAGADEAGPEFGLGEVLDGRRTLSSVVQTDELTKVSVLAAGSTSSVTMAALAGHGVEHVIAELREAHDYVIVVGRSVLESAESLQLAHGVGAAVLISPVPPSTGWEIAEGERLLGMSGSALLGRVVILDHESDGFNDKTDTEFASNRGETIRED